MEFNVRKKGQGVEKTGKQAWFASSHRFEGLHDVGRLARRSGRVGRVEVLRRLSEGEVVNEGGDVNAVHAPPVLRPHLRKGSEIRMKHTHQKLKTIYTTYVLA